MQNNPLKQFFRRPAVYFKLPSQGKNYEPGVIEVPESGEFPVYPMTAIDEITVRTPDALFNGTALVDLIKSCLPNIKDPWKLNSNDIDAVLIAIRAASGQPDLEVETACPKCSHVASYSLNLLSVLSNLTYGEYDKLLEVNDLKLKFRPLNYKEMNEAGVAQFEIQRRFADVDSIKDEDEKTKKTFEGLRVVTELTMNILAQTIEYIETPTSRVDTKEFIAEFLHNCDGVLFAAIRDHNSKLKISTDLKPLEIKCTECGNEYTQNYMLNPSDFFA